MKNHNEKTGIAVSEAVTNFCRKEYAHKGFPTKNDLANLENLAHDHPSSEVRKVANLAVDKITAIELILQNDVST